MSAPARERDSSALPGTTVWADLTLPSLEEGAEKIVGHVDSSPELLPDDGSPGDIYLQVLIHEEDVILVPCLHSQIV